MDQNDDNNLVKNILKEQGVLKNGQDTIVYEKVAFAGKQEKENIQINNLPKDEKMEEVLDELRNMRENLSSLQAQRQTIHVETRPSQPFQQS